MLDTHIHYEGFIRLQGSFQCRGEIRGLLYFNTIRAEGFCHGGEIGGVRLTSGVYREVRQDLSIECPSLQTTDGSLEVWPETPILPKPSFS